MNREGRLEPWSPAPGGVDFLKEIEEQKRTSWGDVRIQLYGSMARIVNDDFFTPAEIRGSLQILCAMHNGMKKRLQHAEPN